MSITEREPARPGEARRAPPEAPPEPETAVTLTCPCCRVGRNCFGCPLPLLGARPPIRHPAGRAAASIGGPYWRFRGLALGAHSRPLTRGDGPACRGEAFKPGPSLTGKANNDNRER
jgi:hypothetical protein